MGKKECEGSKRGQAEDSNLPLWIARIIHPGYFVTFLSLQGLAPKRSCYSLIDFSKPSFPANFFPFFQIHIYIYSFNVKGISHPVGSTNRKIIFSKKFSPHPPPPIKKEEEEEERQTPPGRKIDRISFFHPVLQDIIKGY